MARKKERKTTKGMHSDVAMREALGAVKKGMKFATAANHFGVDRTTLRRYAKRFEDVDEIPDDVILTSKFNHNQVFTSQQEQELVDYLLLRSAIGYGLSAKELRKCAFEYAMHNTIKVPKSWEEKQEAGLEWFWSFMKRHPTLSSRKPEQCSIARAAAFNKINIDNYFDKLGSTIQRHPHFVDGSRKWNLDETATSTVGAVKEKVISPKGQKQVHQIKSHERGTSVTTCCFINALGQSIPPVMIFPRKNFQKTMLADAYPGTLGLANKAGYMTMDMFIPTMKHFIKHTKSSKEEPTLLIVDNVGSHLSLECLNLCKDNGVTLFTLPPHTTHRTQPLDVGVFGPFQTAYDIAVQQWTVANPGIPASIHKVAQFVNVAWSKSATPANIISAFKATGIHPFNRNIFDDKEFMPSLVTHVEHQDPGPSNQATVVMGSEQENNDLASEQEIDIPDVPNPPNETNSSSPRSNLTSPTPSVASSHRSPLELFGIPKVKPNPKKRVGRRKGKCMVATDTPEKKIIEDRALLKKQQEEAKKRRQDLRNQKKSQPKITPKRAAKRAKKTLFVEDEEDDGSTESSESDSGSEEEEEEIFQPLTKDPDEGDYVLVEFPVTGNEKKYYIGKILKNKDEEGDLEISYLRQSLKLSGKFVLPQVPDLQSVHVSDVKMILPKPMTGGTRRQQNMLQFPNVKLGHLKIG